MATATAIRKLMERSAEGKACAKAVKEALAFIDKKIKEVAIKGKTECHFYYSEQPRYSWSVEHVEPYLYSFSDKHNVRYSSEFLKKIEDTLRQNGFRVGSNDGKMYVNW